MPNFVRTFAATPNDQSEALLDQIEGLDTAAGIERVHSGQTRFLCKIDASVLRW